MKNYGVRISRVINCAAVADSLLETELFGHDRGAYTGADRQVPGKLELASNGTLFLDEIGNMSLPFQRNLLRPVTERYHVRCARANPNPPPPDATPGSCDTIVQDSTCMQHGAEAFANLPAKSRSGICRSLAGGTYSRSPCPAEGLVGRCPQAGGQLKHYYSVGGSPHTVESARQACGSTFAAAQ